MIDLSVLQRVFRISCGAKVGTAFVIDHKDHLLLVTAAHILPSGDPKPEVTLTDIATKTTILRLELLKVEPEGIDISVARLSDAPLTKFPLPAGSDGFQLGQDLIFAGFPLGLDGIGMNGGRFPLVKRALLSGHINDDGRDLWLLDGHNNPGFSGAPVVGIPPLKNNVHILGVINSYIIDDGANSGIIIATDIGHAVRAANSAEPVT